MIRGMLPAQRVVACLKFYAFCKRHRRRVCSLLRAKREPERTAVPAGHESPGGAFKPQTGLRSKYRAFSAARSPLLSRRGRRRVAAPCVCFVPCAALASCRPLPQQLLPVSATGRGRRRCKLGAARPFQTPKLLGSIQKIQVASLKDFLCSADWKPLSRCATAPQVGASAPASFAVCPETLPSCQGLSLWESWQARQGLTERASQLPGAHSKSLIRLPKPCSF